MISALSTNLLWQFYDHSERSQITPYDKLSDILSLHYPIAQKIINTPAEHRFVSSAEDHFPLPVRVHIKLDPCDAKALLITAAAAGFQIKNTWLAFQLRNFPVILLYSPQLKESKT
ncbi:hypothetical protein [Gimesia maris]|uniref:hypothetical protein n=1 Tax=Gimesia maris TaxID=122 RepID=UPI0012B8D58A|nr:hypothetical protein [Gimesia maris]